MRVAFVACSTPARTAVGNLLAEKVAFFLDRGAEVRVFLESTAALHPQLTAHASSLKTVPTAGPAWDALRQSDLVFFEFSQGFDLLGLLPLLVPERPKLIATYYGISPSAGWPGPQRELLERGYRDRGLLWCADAVSVLSAFTIDELTAATHLPHDRFQRHTIPMDLERWHAGPSRTPARPTLLFVGRAAPNKRLPLVIEALVDLPEAEAWIVGNDRDIYAEQARAARSLAEKLGVADRVRWLGDLPDNALPELYRQASVLVLPSIHEGFGIPVLEAQASGLPVVAARAAALPETLADAGLSFRPDDREDFVRQLRRVLTPQQTSPAKKRIALVAFRFGAGFVGGAESSLRNLGRTLQTQGYDVEVFTTCTLREFDWKNDLPAGSSDEDGFLVHRFPIDPHDRPRHDNAFRIILEKNGSVPPALEAEFLANSIHSAALLGALAARRHDFDAFIAAPYLHGLTFRVAQTFPETTVLLPCFHDEPSAHLQAWLDVYTHVAGILYHSPEEQAFAQTTLGLNHPGATTVGAWLPAAPQHPKPTTPTRTLVYCGRYSREKNVPQLLDFAARYQANHPDRFRWVFMGEGSVRIPAWASDLGRVSDSAKHRALAEADALVQLSTQESLSLVVLEAWRQSTPVIVRNDAPVLAGHIARCGGGIAISDYETFAQGLDDLWNDPKSWSQRGQTGQDYVRTHYLDQDAFARRLTGALDHARLPVAEQMRRRGLARAQEYSRTAWRNELDRFVEKLLDAPPRAAKWRLTLEPLATQLQASVQQSSLLLPIRVVNHGHLPSIAKGPAATRVEVTLRDDLDREVEPPRLVPLGDMTLPGCSSVTLMPIDLPQSPGQYTLTLNVPGAEEVRLPLAVGEGPSHAVFEGGVGPLLQAAQSALAQAHTRQTLPLDYVDVCEGRFARWKRWAKLKLLNNFKRAYVDVLSAQQSEINHQLIESVQHLSECCRALDQTVRSLQERVKELSAVEREENEPNAGIPRRVG